MLHQDYSIIYQTISYLKFPLIVAVVFIHSSPYGVSALEGINEGGLYIYELVRHIISDEVARIAVPLFFFNSGFLFFYNSKFTVRVYGQKLKRRFWSLLVPYISWNFLFAFLFLIKDLLFSATDNANFTMLHKPIEDWLNIFWSYSRSGSNTYPFLYPLWFVRDLMVTVVFSPFIYLFLMYLKIWPVVFWGSLWLLGFTFNVAGFSVTAFLFFTLGAYFSIYKYDLFIHAQKIRKKITICYLILLTVNIFLWISQCSFACYIHKISVLIGIIAVISWVVFGLEMNYLSTNSFLAKSSFFIFAYHAFPIHYLNSFWPNFLGGGGGERLKVCCLDTS